MRYLIGPASAVLLRTSRPRCNRDPSGKFGFYADSQEQSKFDFVGFNPAP